LHSGVKRAECSGDANFVCIDRQFSLIPFKKLNAVSCLSGLRLGAKRVHSQCNFIYGIQTNGGASRRSQRKQWQLARRPLGEWIVRLRHYVDEPELLAPNNLDSVLG
jgi:hypothetical protein